MSDKRSLPAAVGLTKVSAEPAWQISGIIKK